MSKKGGPTDGVYDNPKKQTWEDVKVDDKGREVGEAIHAAKRWQAHSYISSYAQVDNALKTITSIDSKLTLDLLLTKAAAKAFSKIFKHKGGLTVAHV
jgi:hypothetical protein